MKRVSSKRSFESMLAEQAHACTTSPQDGSHSASRSFESMLAEEASRRAIDSLLHPATNPLSGQASVRGAHSDSHLASLALLGEGRAHANEGEILAALLAADEDRNSSSSSSSSRRTGLQSSHAAARAQPPVVDGSLESSESQQRGGMRKLASYGSLADRLDEFSMF